MIQIHKIEDRTHYFIKQLLRTLTVKGYYLTPESKILDFGCKLGAMVCALRKAGFNAYGFDIHDYSSEIEPEYRKYFFFIDNPLKDKSNYEMDWHKFRIPFPDQEFDFVFSHRTLEHVQNHDIVFREIYRVMKPVGVSIHSYVPRYTLMERHMRIPFGSIIRNYNYYLFWARCGLRNRFQIGKSAKWVAARNMEYARTGLNYINPKTMLKKARAYFPSVKFTPEIWYYSRPLLSWCLLSNPWIRFLYNHTCEAILLLEKY